MTALPRRAVSLHGCAQASRDREGVCLLCLCVGPGGARLELRALWCTGPGPARAWGAGWASWGIHQTHVCYSVCHSSSKFSSPLLPQSSCKISIILKFSDHSAYKLGLEKMFNLMILIPNVLPEYFLLWSGIIISLTHFSEVGSGKNSVFSSRSLPQRTSKNSISLLPKPVFMTVTHYRQKKKKKKNQVGDYMCLDTISRT